MVLPRLAFPAAGRSTLHADPRRERAICTFAVGRHRELAAISVAASQAYARRWGWDVVATAEARLADGRPASWAKIPLIIELLGRYEWVWWIDADALIVDPHAT